MPCKEEPFIDLYSTRFNKLRSILVLPSHLWNGHQPMQETGNPTKLLCKNGSGVVGIRDMKAVPGVRFQIQTNLLLVEINTN